MQANRAGNRGHPTLKLDRMRSRAENLFSMSVSNEHASPTSQTSNASELSRIVKVREHTEPNATLEQRKIENVLSFHEMVSHLATSLALAQAALASGQ